jgi:hypothetical protein
MGNLHFDRQDTIRRLRNSFETVAWAARSLPERWTHTLPDYYPDDSWTVAMNLAHLAVYEERLALPLLRALAEGGDGTGSIESGMESWFYGDAVAASSDSVESLLARIGIARSEQIAVCERYDAARWNEPVTMLFASGRHGQAPHSAAWVANKTLQHCWEHGNAVLRMALFAP